MPDQLAHVLVALVAVTAALLWGAPVGCIAIAPAAIVTAVIAAAAPHPRQLRRIGWALVATDLAVFVLLVATH